MSEMDYAAENSDRGLSDEREEQRRLDARIRTGNPTDSLTASEGQQGAPLKMPEGKAEWRMTPFIVAEISKNWIDGQPVVANGSLCQLFEHIIETNRQRGYRLYSFQLHRIMAGPDAMNETIIAVFECIAK